MKSIKAISQFVLYIFWPQIRHVTSGQGLVAHCKRQTDKTWYDNQG